MQMYNQKRPTKQSLSGTSNGGTTSKKLAQTPLMEEKKQFYTLRNDLNLMKIGKISVSDVIKMLIKKMQQGDSDLIWDEIKNLKKEGNFGSEIAQVESLLKIEQMKNTDLEPSTEKDFLMAKQEIEKYLNTFRQGGAHIFISELHHKGFSGRWGDWNKENKENFIAPISEADKIVSKSLEGQGFKTLEKELGLQKWSLFDKCPNGVIYRYIIPQNKIDSIATDMAHAFIYSRTGLESNTIGKQDDGEKEAIVNFFKGKDGREFQNAIFSRVIKIEALDLSEETPEPEENKFSSIHKG